MPIRSEKRSIASEADMPLIIIALRPFISSDSSPSSSKARLQISMAFGSCMPDSSRVVTRQKKRGISFIRCSFLSDEDRLMFQAERMTIRSPKKGAITNGNPASFSTAAVMITEEGTSTATTSSIFKKFKEHWTSGVH